MKCKWCSFISSNKRDMAIHIKNNHKSKLPVSVTSSSSFDDYSPSFDISDFTDDTSTSSDFDGGGGGSFDGGGASDDY